MEYTSVTVVSVTDVGGDAVAVELEAPSSFAGEPGQFVSLRLDAETPARFYTLSSPDTEDSFEVTVGVDPEGDVSPRIAALEPGDEVDVSPPLGDTHYDGEDDVFVAAGGPGIGAALAIAERTLSEDGEAVLVYRDDAPSHESRLAALSRRGATVYLLSAADDLHTTIDAAASPDVEIAFVFGFNEFVTTAEDALADAGVSADAIDAEGFGHSPDS